MPASADLPARRLFVLAGMPRAGTTYMYHAFAAHPGAFVPYRKELRFFSLNFHRGEEWYERFFSKAGPDAVRVDISPDYFMDGAAPGRLREFSPRRRVALAVRDPADWAVSLHRRICTLQGKTPRFDEFLAGAEYPRFDLGWRGGRRLRFSLRERFVESQLNAYCGSLGESLLLYDFSWFERDPLAVLNTLEAFLGVPRFFNRRTMPAGAINARENKKPGWLSRLASRDLLVDAAGRVLPRRFLVGLRMKMDRAGARGHGRATKAGDDKDRSIARAELASDCAFVEALFSRSPAVLGDGRPVPGCAS